jgi:hypothetical protein
MFAGHLDWDRKKVSALAEGGRILPHVQRRDGEDTRLRCDRPGLANVETPLTRVLSGERVAGLTEDQELSPREA